MTSFQPPAMSLRHEALAALCLTDPADKADATLRLGERARTADDSAWLADAPIVAPATGIPGRPAAPVLVPPSEVPRRRAIDTPHGRAVLLHALAHIEFNAINLALDAVWRFAGMPVAFYRDWMRVAAEEATHFSLLSAHLATLDCRYGDHPAHDGLWQMTEKTAADPLARMALVPRTLEARGLDASPPIRAKLAAAGDMAAAGILDIILRDEIGHVAVGNRWYRWLCERAGLDPLPTYRRLAEQYGAPRLRGPFNLDARRQAGFDDDEIAALEASF
ncbi:ferritin-like domain-containing protein [Ralstonia pseudosolanacearum]|uniref:ferritin-like domain-containing protein n=1 Tax=Ralstonia pseudosolanacearum TaxID=1310165 RepID=UPI00048AB4D8|nr:ferritin-like domain-containing protein [Ralstonia pseudosolanacearum]MCL1620008.1 ferritin-like domain-containing protein [Ralstonia pseudosolanacearum CaRs-Mep]MCQ4680439.1 ferritin-like domain-containing protein [Ralstonia pseudosolanacearum]